MTIFSSTIFFDETSSSLRSIKLVAVPAGYAIDGDHERSPMKILRQRRILRKCNLHARRRSRAQQLHLPPVPPSQPNSRQPEASINWQVIVRFHDEDGRHQPRRRRENRRWIVPDHQPRLPADPHESCIIWNLEQCDHAGRDRPCAAEYRRIQNLRRRTGEAGTGELPEADLCSRHSINYGLVAEKCAAR